MTVWSVAVDVFKKKSLLLFVQYGCWFWKEEGLIKIEYN